MKREQPRNRSIPDNAICFFPEGNQWACVYGDFENLQETPAGFGRTRVEAYDDLKRQEDRQVEPAC